MKLRKYMLQLIVVLLLAADCSPGSTPPDPAAQPQASLTSEPPSQLAFHQSPQRFDSIPTWRIALADLDGDGDLDAVFANAQVEPARVWLNDGYGVFTDTGQALGDNRHGVDVGDVDGDGDPDIVLTTFRTGLTTLVFLNDGQALFTELEGAFQTNIGFSVTLLDLDGDGDLDAAGNYLSAARIYSNDGAGMFSLGDTAFLLTAEWGDLDADGDVDAFIKRDGYGYAVHVNDGAGGFSEGWHLEDDEAMQQGDMALGDVDSDGDVDVVLANGFFETTSYPARVLLNDGNGQFADSGQRLSAVTNAGLALGDLDLDGDLDLVLTDYLQPCQIWLNDGTGHFEDSGIRIAGGEFYRHAHLGDLDGDGDLDIFLATYGTDHGPNEIWFNDLR